MVFPAMFSYPLIIAISGVATVGPAGYMPNQNAWVPYQLASVAGYVIPEVQCRIYELYCGNVICTVHL